MTKEERQARRERVVKFRESCDSKILDLKSYMSWENPDKSQPLPPEHDLILKVISTFDYRKDCNVISRRHHEHISEAKLNMEHYKKLYQDELAKNKTLSDKIKEATTSSGLFIAEVRRKLGF